MAAQIHLLQGGEPSEANPLLFFDEEGRLGETDLRGDGLQQTIGQPSLQGTDPRGIAREWPVGNKGIHHI